MTLIRHTGIRGNAQGDALIQKLTLNDPETHKALLSYLIEELGGEGLIQGLERAGYHITQRL